MKIKAVIFDMDGTIFDTESIYLEMVASIIEKNGGQSNEQELNDLSGKSIEQVVDFIISKTNIDQKLVEKDFAKIYVEFLKSKGLQLKEGMLNLLNFLKSNSLRFALATSANRSLVELNFEKSPLNLNDFEFVLTREDVVNPKPDKEIYEKAVQKLGLKPNECLVIEDSKVGAMAGINAGCIVAYVPENKNLKSEIDGLVNFKFENLNQIIEILK